MFYEIYPIENICTLVKGTYSSTKTEPGDFPLVVTAAQRRNADTYQLEGPAVCIPLISSTGHGDAALHRVHYQEGYFALADLLVALIPKDTTICNAKYLFHLFMAKKEEYFIPLMSGTANVSLKIQDIAKVNVPLPPLEEQHRIVARIEELAAKIEEARGLRRESVEEAENAIFSIMHIVFEKFDEQKDVDLIPLDQATKIFGGGTPSKSNYEFWQGIIPWVSPKDMKVNDIYDSEDHISELALETGTSTLIPENSVLLVVRSGILRRTLPIAINRVPVTINQDMKALIPSDGLSCEFLAWWFKSKENIFLEHVKGGTTVQSLMWDKVSKTLIGIPSRSIQVEIVSYLQSLQAKIDRLQRHQAETTKELDALLPSILNKAFKGEL